MKTELIKALKKTIDDLKTGKKYYTWLAVDSCNCGVLAQNICSVDADGLASIRARGSWQSQCRVTGIELNEVFRRLIDVGLTKRDIHELEHLENEDILKEARIDVSKYSYYTKKENVISYMQAWVRILEREGVPETKNEIVQPVETQNKPMEFVKYEEMKQVQELLFQN